MSLPSLVLDSWAVIAFLEDEPAALEVETVILDAVQTGKALFMTVVNLGEVWYSLARVHSPRVADDAIGRIQSIGVRIIPANWDLTYRAAQFKAEKPVAYADCFAAALAEAEEADLVTGDKEFILFEKEIKIHWL